MVQRQKASYIGLRREGCVFIHAEGSITSRCKLLTSTAQNTVEAEYAALLFSVRQALWLQELLLEIYSHDYKSQIKIHEELRNVFLLFWMTL